MHAHPGPAACMADTFVSAVRTLACVQILGEKLVLAANGRGGLATVALRPSGIFGEGDTLLVPLTVANAKRGKMKYVIGSGRNFMDFTYVGNVAHAHLLVNFPPVPADMPCNKRPLLAAHSMTAAFL